MDGCHVLRIEGVRDVVGLDPVLRAPHEKRCRFALGGEVGACITSHRITSHTNASYTRRPLQADHCCTSMEHGRPPSEERPSASRAKILRAYEQAFGRDGARSRRVDGGRWKTEQMKKVLAQHQPRSTLPFSGNSH